MPRTHSFLTAIEQAQTARVTTDQADYAPGATVIITGSGFLANEVVTLQVTHITGGAEGGAGHEPWDVTADAQGGFTSSWYVDPFDSVGAAFLLTATGTSTPTVSTTFTDSAAASLEQCRNGAADSPNNCAELGGGTGWGTANVGAQQGHLIEGFSIPYRAVLGSLPIGTELQLDLGYDIKNSGANAIDFLTHYQRLESHFGFGHPAELVLPTSGVDFVPGNGAESDIDPFTGTPTTFDIPEPALPAAPSTRFNSLPDAEREMTLFGGTITGVSYVSQGNLAAAQSQTVIRVRFIPTGSVAVLAWGGHIARGADWGEGNSASGINGSPYHMSLVGWDCVSAAVCAALPNATRPGNLGSQDRSLSAVSVIPTGTVIIRKIVASGTAGEGDFVFTGLGGFTLGSDEQTDPITVLSNAGGGAGPAIVVTEQEPPLGYDFLNVVCNDADSTETTDPAVRSTSILVSPNETVTCTFTNTIDLEETSGRIVVQKQTNPDGDSTSFDFTRTGGAGAAFSLSDNQSNDTGFTLAPGAYSVAESTPPTGWSLTSATCTSSAGDSETPASISLQVGETVTCVFTNTKDATLTLVKTVINNNGGTRQISDFALFIDGQVTLSGAANTVAAGGHTASETTLPGYTPSAWGGDCAADGSVTLVPGDNKTCTITNDDQAANLIIIKNVINDSGGTAVAADFSGTIGGTATFTGGATWTGVVTPGQSHAMTAAGTYSVTETAAPGYATTYSADCTGSIALGETKTCTVTNDDQPAKLIIIKNVINDSGGGAAASAFSGTIGGTATFAGGATWTGVVTPGETHAMTAAGTYSVTETAAPGYATTYSAECSGSIALGETKTCTVTNDDQAAKLIIIKNVINDSGGTALASAFSGTIGGTATFAGGATWTGVVTPGETHAMTAAGTYSVTETAAPGYATTYSADCTGSIALGDTKTCTVTNDDQPAKLIIIKNVINDSGGGAAASAFSGTIGGTATFAGGTTWSGVVAPGETHPMTAAGTYSVTETPAAGYATTYSAECTGSIALGETKTCTVTNDDRPAKLIIIKNVINDNGGGAAASAFSGTIGGTATFAGGTTWSGVVAPGETHPMTAAGTYSVTETAAPGYATSYSAECTGSIALGETKTCTVTNNDIQPTLTLVKTVINDNGGTKIVSDFPLFISGTPVTSSVPVGLNAGTYGASETTQYGYTAGSWGGHCAANGSVNLAVGENKTCTITNNDQPGTIVVIKNAKPATGSFTFTTTTSDGSNPTLPDYAGFVLNGDPTGGGNQNSQTLDAGTYTVQESTQLGWILTGLGGGGPGPYDCVVTGSGGSTGVGDLTTQTATITLKNGDTVTCTFENTGQGVTRTQGFWATHSPLANIAWFGGSAFGHTFPGVTGTTGIGDGLLCGRPIDTLGKLMGGFWSDIPKKTTNAKRTPLDQARMQLLQQMLAAELNASAFGSVPAGGIGSFAAWEAAYCGTNQGAIQNAMQAAASFNTSGDSGTFTPGTSADSKNARAIANKLFWDILP